jgi:hypothetical protein
MAWAALPLAFPLASDPWVTARPLWVSWENPGVENPKTTINRLINPTIIFITPPYLWTT